MIKYIIYIPFLVLIYLSLAQENGARIDTYNINADFCSNPDSAGISLSIILFNPAHKSEINLLLNSEVKIYSINSEVVPGKIGYKFMGKDSISIFLEPNLAKEDTLKIMFNYRYPITIAEDSINILDRGNRWYPLIPDNIAKFRLKCQIPLNYEAIFSGKVSNKKNFDTYTLYEWETNYPIFKGALVIFREKIYKEFRCDLSGNIVALNYFPDDSLDINKIITETGRMMNFCSSNIGAFKYERLSLIEITGLEGISIGSGLIMIGSSDLKHINKGYNDGLLLAIAEQWFGAGVFSKFGANGFWLTSLSLPHYIRMLYLKETYREEKFNDALIKPLDKYKEFAGGEKDIPIYDIDMPNTPEKAKVLYIKGPYLFYKLHMAMGDEKWKEFIQEIFRTYFGKVMSLNDFINTLRKYDVKGNVTVLFNTMIFNKGLPE